VVHEDVGVGQQAAQAVEGHFGQFAAVCGARLEAEREVDLVGLDLERADPVQLDDARPGFRGRRPPRCCGSGTCIIDTEGRCWCGQQWDGEKMAAPALSPPGVTGGAPEPAPAAGPDPGP
jgi:hypothetical protein